MVVCTISFSFSFPSFGPGKIRSIGSVASLPVQAFMGVTPVDTHSLLLYAKTAIGRVFTQSGSCLSKYTLNMVLRVLWNRSMLLDWGEYGGVVVLFISNLRHNSDHKLFVNSVPWSE